jgi:hypothetical protein
MWDTQVPLSKSLKSLGLEATKDTPLTPGTHRKMGKTQRKRFYRSQHNRFLPANTQTVASVSLVFPSSDITESLTECATVVASIYPT